MSVITNIVLTIGITDELRGKTAAVNEYFGEVKGLVSINDPSLPDSWYGGNKRVCAGVFIGAFNGMDLSCFIKHLRSIQWDSPKKVQLLVKEEDDERFRLINVMEDSG